MRRAEDPVVLYGCVPPSSRESENIMPVGGEQRAAPRLAGAGGVDGLAVGWWLFWVFDGGVTTPDQILIGLIPKIPCFPFSACRFRSIFKAFSTQANKREVGMH